MASRKLQVYDFAWRYRMRWARSPSQGEIAAGVGISKTRVRQHLKRLELDGLIVRKRGARRGIEFPEPVVTEADALRTLKALGYPILFQQTYDPCTFPTLPDLPELTHLPDVEIQLGGGSANDITRTRRDRAG